MMETRSFGATAGQKWTHPLSENGPTQPEIAELK